jgi:hypothetical protein
MTRLRRDLEIEVPDRLDATIELIIGPCVLSEKQLEVAWEAYGDEITGWQHRADASRPWGYWRFVLGEEMPRPHWNPEAHRMEEKHAETIRLAELGELTDEEVAAIAEKANEAKLRVNTDSEQIGGGNRDSPGAEFPDREAVELYEAVTAAIKAGDSAS